ncbi:MAG: excinuclease ABC subunit UvrC [Bacteroidota bacterium]
MTKEDLSLQVKALPEKPGVYQYFDANEKIIYVGKAKNLKKRVSSYFSKTHENAKTAILVRQIVSLRYIVVDTEADALFLENSLIKKYQPKYNIALKDDKTYPWICIKNEPFPRIFQTRQRLHDQSKYYGPYANVRVMQTLLSLIRELYLPRTCSLDLQPQKIKEKKFKVCLEYHIGNCLGPCVEQQSKESYDENFRQIEHLLKGNISSVIRFVKEKMNEHAQKQAYELANEMKQRLQLLEQFQAKSTIVSPSIHKVDVLTILDDDKSAYFNYFVLNNGSIIHSYTAEVQKKLDETKEELISYLLPEMRERYLSDSPEVLVELPLDLKIEGIKFTVPSRGDKKQLIELSQRNAKYYRIDKTKQEKIKDPERHTQRILEQIQKDFRLTELPIHIECFDNSNFQGTNAVSACVVFKNAKPSKKDYRHFNVKTVEGPDDFATMEEVVYRRYKRMLDEEQSLPQLIVIDGGKGQLGAALKALEQLNLRGKVAIVGIAKRLEEIFFPGDSLPIYIDKRSESLKVIQQLRNEAHRFGITHHRDKRSKASLTSSIDHVPGIGEKNKEKLFKAFKTMKAIELANLEELINVLGTAKGKLVFEYFAKGG